MSVMVTWWCFGVGDVGLLVCFGVDSGCFIAWCWRNIDSRCFWLLASFVWVVGVGLVWCGLGVWCFMAFFGFSGCFSFVWVGII